MAMYMLRVREFGGQTDLAAAVKPKAENGEFGEARGTLGAYADSRRVIIIFLSLRDSLCCFYLFPRIWIKLNIFEQQ